MKYYLYNPLANNGIKSHIPEGAQLIDASKTDYQEFFAGLKENDEVVLIGGDGTINFFPEVSGKPCCNQISYNYH